MLIGAMIIVVFIVNTFYNGIIWHPGGGYDVDYF